MELGGGYWDVGLGGGEEAGIDWEVHYKYKGTSEDCNETS